jgi:hypothetical protein
LRRPSDSNSIDPSVLAREHAVPLPDELLGKPAIKRLVLLEAPEIGPLNF